MLPIAQRRSELEILTPRPNHQKHGIKFGKRCFLQSPLEPVFGSWVIKVRRLGEGFTPLSDKKPKKPFRRIPCITTPIPTLFRTANPALT